MLFSTLIPNYQSREYGLNGLGYSRYLLEIPDSPNHPSSENSLAS